MERTAISDLYIRGIRISREIPQGSYLNTLPVVRYLKEQDELILSSRITFFVGENGVGKSTLMEALAISMGFNPEGGSANFRFSTMDSHSDLHKYLTVIKGTARRQDGFFLRAESFYNLASDIDRMDREPSLESFLSLMENRFGSRGLYLLDEPESALSPMRLMSLICLIHRLAEDGAQFIISSHSPILMAIPGAQIFVLSEDGIQLTPYQETEHFRITRQFLNAPEKMLSYLLK